MRLAGRTAIITGAGSGMGRAMAELFVAEGANVVASDVVKERVEAVVQAITAAGGGPTGGPAGGKATGGQVAGVVADVSKVADVNRMVDEALSRFGTVDVLVNNAGIMDRMLPVDEVDDEVWERVLGVNLTGPFLTCRRVLPHMVERGKGVIINVASIGGLEGGRAGAAYTTSKHGLVGLTKNIAWAYLEKGIRAVAICPGAVETAIGVGGVPSQAGMARAQKGMVTMPRVGKPEEIARVALFLASDEASYVNGATVTVDGGWTSY